MVADEGVLNHNTSIRKEKLVNEDPDFARKITEVTCHYMQEKSCYMLQIKVEACEIINPQASLNFACNYQ
jgi:hypothetical protein